MRALKRAVWRAAAAAGKVVPHGRVPILTYHSIDDSGSTVSVAPRAFERQMEYLHRHRFRVLALGDYLMRLQQGGPSRGPEVVITFDDAFRNVREAALPVLRRLGFTATVFVPTGHVGGLPRWQMKAGLPVLPLMDWEEIVDLERQGFDVQSHSRSHPRLSTLGEPEIQAEVAASKQELERRLGKGIDLFCYPYGDTDDRVIAALERAGYRGAVTIDFGTNPRDADRFRLRRVGSARFVEPLAFEACVWGIYPSLVRAGGTRLRRILAGRRPSGPPADS